MSAVRTMHDKLREVIADYEGTDNGRSIGAIMVSYEILHDPEQTGPARTGTIRIGRPQP